MAEKRKSDVLDETTVTGYLHNIEMKDTYNRYFDGYIQTNSSNFTRLVCFSPEKLNSFQSAENLKSPVKLTNIKVEPKRGKTEITFNRKSDIQICKALDFSRKSEMSIVPAPDKNIKELLSANMMCSVSIKMVKFLAQEEMKETKYGLKKLRTALVADETGIIKLPLWQANIEKMVVGECYKITNLLTTMFMSTLQLNTTATTTFTKIEELTSVVEDVEMLQNTSTFCGAVQCCQVSSHIKCINCRKALVIPDGSHAVTVKCDFCKSKQKISACSSTKTLNVQIINENKENKKFVVFSPALLQFLDRNNITSKTDDEIEDFFLSSKLMITHEINSDIATSIEITE